MFYLLVTKFQLILTSDFRVMLHLVISTEGVWDRYRHYDNQFFQTSFALCFVVRASKVSNDLDKYLRDIGYLRIT